MKECDKQKLIFLDIDGTIYSVTGVIPESAKIAIGKARKNGHKIYLSTGRSRAELPKDILSLEFDGIIASGGAYVEVAGDLIFNQDIKPELLKDIYKYLLNNEIDFTIETNDFIYGRKEQIQNQKRIYEGHREKCRDRYEKIIDRSLYKTESANVDEGINQFIKLLIMIEDIHQVKGVNKIMFSNSKISSEQMKRDIGELVTVIPGSLDYLLRESGEIYHKRISKATGVEKILGHLGAKQEDTVAFGDGLNDIEMLRFAGIGVAMGNAAEELKRAADFVTKENFKDGLYYGFDTFGLI